ncbi:MAG: protein translocase subunit SecF [Candidatus Moranbacteria bacterium]|nr:protein translocase subunit SecF [Candidatus Moranbacteria bacterium]
MFIVKYRKIFIGLSIVFVTLSVCAIAFWGLNFGIDFKGGSLLEVAYSGARPEQSAVESSLKELSLGDILVQPIGENGYSFKTKDITESQKIDIMKSLGDGVTETSFTSIGPSVGAELVRKSVTSFILVALGIILWIAFSFRKVSHPVSSWKYGLIAVTALIHDVTISAGFFAVFSHLMGRDADTLFVVAILTVLGLSVSDTIVVFDRIRENIRTSHSKTFEEIVGSSIGQVYTRSIITSLTVIVVLLSLVFFGPSSTKLFALTLTVGMFFGTYSSIFLASPLLVMVKNIQDKGKKKK